MGFFVAITGGIACGKSLFAGHFRALGAEVLDTDDVTHALEAPGGAAVGPIRQRFGDGMIAADGGVDRARLAELVFADASAREDLNALLHPMVREAVREWRERPGASGIRAAVIPLLYEAGWAGDWDVVICVSSHTQAQVDRLMRFRGLSAEQARQRVAAQMPVAEKAAKADLTAENNAGPEGLADEAARIYRLLMERPENEY